MTESMAAKLATQAARELRGTAPEWRVMAFRANGIGARELRRSFGADLAAAVAYASTLTGADGVVSVQIDLANAVEGSCAFATVEA